MLIRNRQLLAALGTTGSQHAAAILRGHPLTETMLVCSPAIVGLECSFHLCCYYYLILFHHLTPFRCEGSLHAALPARRNSHYFTVWGAKVLISFQFTKNL